MVLAAVMLTGVVARAEGASPASGSTGGASSPQRSTHAASDNHGITLFKGSPDLSFGLSFPHRNQPDTASAFEHRQTYDRLKDRLDNENDSGLPPFPAPFDQLDGMNLNFKYSF